MEEATSKDCNQILLPNNFLVIPSTFVQILVELGRRVQTCAGLQAQPKVGGAERSTQARDDPTQSPAIPHLQQFIFADIGAPR